MQGARGELDCVPEELLTSAGALAPSAGQDLITPPTDLMVEKVVVSVEPEMDDSPDPFAIKPLMDATVEDVGPVTVQPIANIASKGNPPGVP